MKFIQGKDRTQVEFSCLEEQIEHNNDVRLIDLFVQSVALADAGFRVDFIENGRPSSQNESHSLIYFLSCKVQVYKLEQKYFCFSNIAKH